MYIFGVSLLIRSTLNHTHIHIYIQYVTPDREYPVIGGDGIKHRPEDKQNQILLLQEIRSQLNARNSAYLLTIAAPAGQLNAISLDIPGLTAVVDWINLMSYGEYIIIVIVLF